MTDPDDDLVDDQTKDDDQAVDVDHSMDGPATDDELFGEVLAQLADMNTTITDLGAAVEAASTDHQTLVELGDKVDKIIALLGDDDEDPESNRPPSERFRFERIPEPKKPKDLSRDEEAERRAGELRRWVNWLVRTYRMWENVPPCWERHDALAEELAALYVAWAGAWSGHERSDQAVVWHSERERTEERLARWAGNCRAGQDCGFEDDDHRGWQLHHDQLAAAGVRHRISQTQHIIPAPWPLMPPKKDKRDGKPRPSPSSAAATGPGDTAVSPDVDPHTVVDHGYADDGFPDEPPPDDYDDPYPDDLEQQP